jgi:hypothetical protein
VAGRFPLYTDADIRGPLIEALRQRGWDVVRAIDVFPEGTEDHIHFEWAAGEGRVFVAHDLHQSKAAKEWHRQGRPFLGFLTWPQKRHRKLSDGEMVEAFEKIAAEEDPFQGAYPIRYLPLP